MRKLTPTKTSVTCGERSLTEDEYELIIDGCTNLQDKTLIQLAVTLGIRRDDICRLRIEDIDLVNRNLIYLEKKKKNRIRKVPMTASLTNTLIMYIKTLPKNSTYLFPARIKSSTGHISGKTAWNILDRLLKQTNLEPRAFHTLRSSCIKIKQKNGWNVESVAKLLGDTVQTVQNHYSVPSDGELKELMEKVN